jgi:hypothetical protein
MDVQNIDEVTMRKARNKAPVLGQRVFMKA